MVLHEEATIRIRGTESPRYHRLTPPSTSPRRDHASRRPGGRARARAPRSPMARAGPRPLACLARARLCSNARTPSRSVRPTPLARAAELSCPTKCLVPFSAPADRGVSLATFPMDASSREPGASAGPLYGHRGHSTQREQMSRQAGRRTDPRGRQALEGVAGAATACGVARLGQETVVGGLSRWRVSWR